MDRPRAADVRLPPTGLSSIEDLHLPGGHPILQGPVKVRIEGAGLGVVEGDFERPDLRPR